MTSDPTLPGGVALLVFITVVSIAFGIIVRRRSGATIGVAGGTTLFLGLLSASMAIGHLVGVVGMRGDYYGYDFRSAALFLVGMTIFAAGALCIAAARGLQRGQRDWSGRALDGTLLLLLVCGPLIPVQGLAVVLAVPGTVNLIAVVAARRKLASHPAAAT